MNLSGKYPLFKGATRLPTFAGVSANSNYCHLHILCDVIYDDPPLGRSSFWLAVVY